MNDQIETAPVSPALQFADVLSQAINARNLTLERIASRLGAAGSPVSVATLSYWQTGRSLPTRHRSIRALEELERVLEVEPGHLTGALPGDVLTRWDPMGVLTNLDFVTEALADWGYDLRRRFSALSTYQSLVVDEVGRHKTQDVIQTLRCDADGLRGQPVIIQQEESSAQGAPEVVPVTGCTLGRVLRSAERHLVIAELLLPKECRRGDLISWRYRVNWAPSAPEGSGSLEHALAAFTRFETLEITFTGRLPRSLYHRIRPTADAEPETSRELPVSSFVQITLADAAPGVHGLAWEW